ncbi:MAG: hypothetical protein NVSMB24_35240 [Mucilaginibacter sp.]
MDLSIVYINDVHGYLEPHPELFYKGSDEVVMQAGGYPQIASLVKQVRSENEHTLIFDGGDTFHGTLPLVASKGEAIVPALNKAGHWRDGGALGFRLWPGAIEKAFRHVKLPGAGHQCLHGRR